MGPSLLCVVVATAAVVQAQDCRWAPLGAGLTEGFDPSPRAMHVFDDGTGEALYVAGDFQRAGGVRALGIARWDGTQWSDLDGGTFFSGPNALSSFDDGSGPALYAAGDFFQAGGEPAEKIARWTRASGWEPVGGGLDTDGGPALSLATFDDGTGEALYVGGVIETAGGMPVQNIARWDGDAWSDVGGGILGSVFALEVFDDGSGPALYAAGRFSTAGSETAFNIAKWDGVRWTPVGTGLTSFDGRPAVIALEIYDDGTGPALYAGGKFDRPGGGSAEQLINIARWDGTRWSAVGAGVPGWSPTLRTVQTMAVHDRGGGALLYVGGYFDAIETGPANNLATWDGQRWAAVGDGLDNAVFELAVFDAGDGPELIAGGSFMEIDGVTVNFIARLDGCLGDCRADVFPDGVLNLFDFLVFQNLFDAGELAADFDGDGRLTIFDFLVFQNEFAAGC
ncbi:MAG: GC-type dockerin domain-anchored protein [Phycisphaerales bacterium]